MKSLEEFQKREVQWITSCKVCNCIIQFCSLNLLPLSMFLQLSNILLPVKSSNDSNQLQLQENDFLVGRTVICIFPMTRTGRTRGKFTLGNFLIDRQSTRTCYFFSYNGHQRKNSDNFVDFPELWLWLKRCLHLVNLL